MCVFFCIVKSMCYWNLRVLILFAEFGIICLRVKISIQRNWRVFWYYSFNTNNYSMKCVFFAKKSKLMRYGWTKNTKNRWIWAQKRCTHDWNLRFSILFVEFRIMIQWNWVNLYMVWMGKKSINFELEFLEFLHIIQCNGWFCVYYSIESKKLFGGMREITKKLS